MRGTGTAPARWRVMPLLYMANAEVEGKTEFPSETFANLAKGAKRLNPFLVRISYGSFPGADNYVPRIIIFGPAVFILLMFGDDVLPGHASAAVRQLAKGMPGIVELTRKRKMVEVPAGERTWLDMYEYQVSRTKAYRQKIA